MEFAKPFLNLLKILFFGCFAPKLDLLFKTKNKNVHQNTKFPIVFLVPDKMSYSIFSLGYNVLFLENAGTAL